MLIKIFCRAPSHLATALALALALALTLGSGLALGYASPDWGLLGWDGMGGRSV